MQKQPVDFNIGDKVFAHVVHPGGMISEQIIKLPKEGDFYGTNRRMRVSTVIWSQLKEREFVSKDQAQLVTIKLIANRMGVQHRQHYEG